MLTGIQCDKNIYDGRRSTTQPMEMSSLLAGPGNTTPGTGTLSSGSSRTSNNRIPQFTTNNIVLLQELGEGAFGKRQKDFIFYRLNFMNDLSKITCDMNYTFRESLQGRIANR